MTIRLCDLRRARKNQTKKKCYLYKLFYVIENIYYIIIIWNIIINHLNYLRCFSVFEYQLRTHFPGGAVVKNPLPMQDSQKMQVESLDREDPLGKGMATHSSIVGFPVAQMVRNLPVVQETCVWFLGWENPLEKGMDTHHNILACRIPWREEPAGLQSVG